MADTPNDRLIASLKSLHLNEQQRAETVAELKAAWQQESLDHLLSYIHSDLETLPNDATRSICSVLSSRLGSEQPEQSDNQNESWSKALLTVARVAALCTQKRSNSDELSTTRTINSLFSLAQALITRVTISSITHFEVAEMVSDLKTAAAWASPFLSSTLIGIQRSRTTSHSAFSQPLGKAIKPDGDGIPTAPLLLEKESAASLRAASNGPLNAHSHSKDSLSSATPMASREHRVEEVRQSIRLRFVSFITSWAKTSPRSLFAQFLALVCDPGGTAHSVSGAAGRSEAFNLLALMQHDQALSVRTDATNSLTVLLAAAQQGGFLQVAQEK